MVDRSINIGDGSTVQGPVIAGDVSDSFNQTSGGGGAELQEALKQLSQTVSELQDAVADPEHKARVGRYLDNLAAEAKAEKPDQSLLKVSGEGLIEAAKTVATMAAPVATAVKVVLGLLGMAL